MTDRDAAHTVRLAQGGPEPSEAAMNEMVEEAAIILYLADQKSFAQPVSRECWERDACMADETRTRYRIIARSALNAALRRVDGLQAPAPELPPHCAKCGEPHGSANCPYAPPSAPAPSEAEIFRRLAVRLGWAPDFIPFDSVEAAAVYIEELKAIAVEGAGSAPDALRAAVLEALEGQDRHGWSSTDMARHLRAALSGTPQREEQG